MWTDERPEKPESFHYGGDEAALHNLVPMTAFPGQSLFGFGALTTGRWVWRKKKRPRFEIELEQFPFLGVAVIGDGAATAEISRLLGDRKSVV